MKKTLLILCLASMLQPLSAQWLDQNSNTTDDLNDIHFIDPNNGWAVGRFGALVHTTNGGATWSPENSATTKDLNDIYMVDATTGYAVGDGGTVIKYTGSANWTKLTSGTTLDLFGVHFIDASTGWISGDYGRIMMTTNGGSSWTTQVNNSQYTNLFNDIYMLSSNEGWAVGTNGKILKYNGSNWSTITSGINDELLGVDFISSNSGIIVGKSSTILVYNGTSWNTSNSGLTSYNIHNVSMIDATTAYAATSDGFGGVGIILKYNGATWSKNYTYAGIGTEIFYGVSFPDASKGYVCGAGGLIKSLSTVGITENNSGTNLVSVFPNPATETITFNVSLIQSSNVTLSLYDITGREIRSQNYERLPAGDQQIITGNDLQAGAYTYTLRTNNGSYSGKFLKQ